jgi:hypothetical protein
MIRWLAQEEFVGQFEELYRPRRLFLDYRIQCATFVQQLEGEIPFPAVYEVGKFGEPTPTFRWYGAKGNFLFFIDSPYGGEAGFTTITTPRYEAPGKYLWAALTELSELPPILLKRVVWMEGHGAEAARSVFTWDEYGIVTEVYRASCETDAAGLLSFFREVDSDFSYFLGEPEDINLNWVILRDTSNEIIGRYGLRSVTERVAREMSMRDEAIYKVEAEGNRLQGASFKRGEPIRTSDLR